MDKTYFKKLKLQHFGMKNKDIVAEQKGQIMVKLNQALKDGNEEEFQTAFAEFTDLLQESVLEEARGLVEVNDDKILMGRGVRNLTSKERQYYDGVIEAMKSNNPKQALTLIDETMPTTVIDAVFEDITETHPLLNAINFQNTGILTEILVSTLDGRFMATWGKLCDEIVTEMSAGFEVINLEHKKLSAFIPICKAMLEAGPVWIDRYVRAILAEGIANGLEEGIIDGDGLDEPVGMRRNPDGALDPATGYPVITAIPFSEITPETYGALIADLSVGPNGLSRAITKVMLIVNPVDYFSKVFPAVTEKINGSYVEVFPFETELVQSVHVPEGEAIIGLGDRYFFALGTGKGGKLEYSDHYRFLEDERVYLSKLYGNGKPLDGVSFKRLDISYLRPAHPVVRVTDYIDARLEDLALTDELTNEIDLAFDKNNHGIYSVAIEDSTANGDNDTASLVVTGDDTATIVVKNGDDVVAESEGAYALALTAGDNVITITSTIDGVTEAYVMVIDYTEIPVG